jgi:hypothetical protein
MNLFMCGDLLDISVKCDKLKSMTVDVCMNLQKALIDCPEMEKSQWFSLPQPQFPALSALSIQSCKLSSLSLQRCINLKNVALKCDNLIALNLTDCKFLEQLAMQCPILEKLAVSAPRLDFCSQFADMLAKNCPKVNMLSITNTPSLSDESMEILCSGLQNLQALIVSNCESLRSPKIIGNHIVGVQLCDCTNLHNPVFVCSTMNKLTIRNSPKIQDEALNSLCYTASKLKVLEIQGCGSLSAPCIKLPDMIAIVLKDCSLLQETVLTTPALRSLSIAGCDNLSSIKFTCLNMLHELQLQKCKLMDSALFDVVKFTPKLQNVVISSCDYLATIVIPSTYLRNIQFSDCIRLSAVRLYSPILETCSFKNCASLRFSRIEDLWAPEVITTQQPKISLLDIVNCGIDTLLGQVSVIRLSIVSCAALRQIQLGSALLDKVAIIQCPSLLSIGLYGSSHTELLVRNCPLLSKSTLARVKTVQFGSCPSFNDETLHNLLMFDSQTGASIKAVLLENCAVSQLFLQHANLQKLSIRACARLVSIICNSPCLELLEVSACGQLDIEKCQMRGIPAILLRDVLVNEQQFLALLTNNQNVQLHSPLINPERVAQILRNK